MCDNLEARTRKKRKDGQGDQQAMLTRLLKVKVKKKEKEIKSLERKLDEKNKLKPPLQALLISPDKKARIDILFEKQTATIRENWRDYKPGPVMLCCHVHPWAVLADIVAVKHCLLRQVIQSEYQAAGFRTRKKLLNDLRKYYPSITWDSKVTVITWKDPEGFLIDRRLVVLSKNAI